MNFRINRFDFSSIITWFNPIRFENGLIFQTLANMERLLLLTIGKNNQEEAASYEKFTVTHC